MTTSPRRCHSLVTTASAAVLLVIGLAFYPLQDGYRYLPKKWHDSRFSNMWLNGQTLRQSANLATATTSAAIEMPTLRLLHLGHTKEYTRNERRAGLQTAVTSLRADAVLLSGDLVWDPANLAHWRDHFFGIFTGIDTPIFTAPANHDAGDGLQNYRALVRPEPYYRVRIGRIQVVSLTAFAPAEPQLALLQQALIDELPTVLMVGGDVAPFSDAIAKAPSGRILFVATGDGQSVGEWQIGHTTVFVANEHFSRVFEIRGNAFTWTLHCIHCPGVKPTTPLRGGPPLVEELSGQRQ